MPRSSESESSCTTYEERWVPLYFTDGQVCCKFCPLLEMYNRPMCRRTAELIINTNVTGYWCPLLKANENGVIESPFGKDVQT